MTEDPPTLSPETAKTLHAPAAPEDGASAALTPLANRYRLEQRVGRGGMSEVWRAFDQRLGRDVAVKLLGERNATRSFAERLEREARTIARLRHPHIVQIHDIGTDDTGRPFLVMELLQGEPLSERIEATGGLGARAAVERLLPVGAALAYAHSRGVIHRDLKPANVFLTREPDGSEQTKLLDFGVARMLEARRKVTRGWVGTPEFMAPEQLDLGRRLTAAVDQWAFTVLLVETATDEPPFQGEDLSSLFAAIRNAPLSFPRGGGFDGRLFKILARATRKDPDERYPSMQALTDALRGWLVGAREASAFRSRVTEDAPHESLARPMASAQQVTQTLSEPPPEGTLIDEAIFRAFGAPRDGERG